MALHTAAALPVLDAACWRARAASAPVQRSLVEELEALSGQRSRA
jgi:hypothetical protein